MMGTVFPTMLPCVIATIGKSVGLTDSFLRRSLRTLRLRRRTSCGGNFYHLDFGTAEFAIPVYRSRSCLDLLFVYGPRFVVMLFVERLSRSLARKEWLILREGCRRGREWRGGRRWS